MSKLNDSRQAQQVAQPINYLKVFAVLPSRIRLALELAVVKSNGTQRFQGSG